MFAGSPPGPFIPLGPKCLLCAGKGPTGIKERPAGPIISIREG